MILLVCNFLTLLSTYYFSINSIRSPKCYYITFKSHLIVVKICQYFIYLYLFLEDRCDCLSSSDFPSSGSQVFSTLMVKFFDLFHILPFPPSFPSALDSHLIQFHLLSSHSKHTDCYQLVLYITFNKPCLRYLSWSWGFHKNTKARLRHCLTIIQWTVWDWIFSFTLFPNTKCVCCLSF